MSSKLTDKQRAFINAYLVSWNATKAAIEAGYSAKTAYAIGEQNLRKLDIREEIDRRIKAAAMTADEALARLSDHATANVTEFINLDVDELKAHPKAHLLKKVKRTIRTHGEYTTETIEFEVHDPQAALVHILKEQHLKSGEATERVTVHDWRVEAIDYIKAGKVDYRGLAERLGTDLASELFRQAGVAIAQSGD